MESLRTALKRVMLRVDRRLGTSLQRSVEVGRGAAAAVAPDKPSAAWIVAASVLLALPWWRWALRIRVRGPQGPTWFTVPDWAAMRVFEEVFVEAEYAAPVALQPRRIVDLGSNIGVSILFFALRHPGVPITGVEASPTVFKRLQRNVGSFPGVTLRFGAVTAHPGPVVFHEGGASWSGSTRLSEHTGGGEQVEVPGFPLDEVLAAGDVDILKVDIEGGEFDVLPASERIRDVALVMGEIHATPGTPEADQVLAVFKDFDVRSTQFDPTWQWEHFTIFSAVKPRASVPS
ncbi:FkbM family methyltransferase [Solirubrobacter sp. CPCC 204708]|uniref:FkbM family methyltransferase n=1 Tax=Solirubrobacter deserti TaxID=2282478 RepID=A0ABT4RM62_9ACTN|nr:FkbM family methyltransferase [Solirubrobacter deserti]MBE2317975.1 FkbM family methyltransferase [Solirubrobacter deserti]MDA0139654.1 FkbM family methyltransferase [Solirubrobacter deserti]